jgi:hypothetical protein
MGSFFLYRKNFDLGVGIITAITPSGFVPGGNGGARAWRLSTSSGEDEHLDCFFYDFTECLFVEFGGFSFHDGFLLYIVEGLVGLSRLKKKGSTGSDLNFQSSKSMETNISSCHV